MASNNTASIAQARKLVEQLKMEANIDRIKVRPAEPTIAHPALTVRSMLGSSLSLTTFSIESDETNEDGRETS